MNIYTDGGVHSDGEGYGSFKINGSKVKQLVCSFKLGKLTSMEAEYLSILKALDMVSRLPQSLRIENERIKVHTDCLVICRQLNGEYACEAEKIKPLREQLRRLMVETPFDIKKVPREKIVKELGH